MKKKKEKKKRKEKTGPVQLSKVCLSECEALVFFFIYLFNPSCHKNIYKITSLVINNRNLSLLFWTIRKCKRL